jgi:hypothetical protein
MLRAGLYACVSNSYQQTLAMQNRAMWEEAARRGWRIALRSREVTFGAAKQQEAAREFWKLRVALTSLQHVFNRYRDPGWKGRTHNAVSPA